MSMSGLRVHLGSARCDGMIFHVICPPCVKNLYKSIKEFFNSQADFGGKFDNIHQRMITRKIGATFS